MTGYPDIAARFAEDTAGHRMLILKDDGLYRHLRFTSRPRGWGEYWFDLITWPGCLTVRGDYGDAFTFTREPDMLPFFRADRRWGINPHYWAQKLDGHRQSAKCYSEDTFRQIVCELFVAAVQCDDAPRGLGKAVRAEILNGDLSSESEARKALESFEYKGFRFEDTWEFSFQDYERDFLWACYAIVWGIARYDRVRKYGLTALATPAAEEKSSRPAADATPGEDYPGETDMLRGLVATLRAVAEHGGLTDVQKLLAEHASDDTAARQGAAS